MKKILFMFLCFSLALPLLAQDDNTDTSTDVDEKAQNRDISSEDDADMNTDELDKKERKIDQDSTEPENVSEEDEDL